MTVIRLYIWSIISYSKTICNRNKLSLEQIWRAKLKKKTLQDCIYENINIDSRIIKR